MQSLSRAYESRSRFEQEAEKMREQQWSKLKAARGNSEKDGGAPGDFILHPCMGLSGCTGLV